MHPIWNPPADAEAIESIFALYDAEKKNSRRHACKASALEQEKESMSDKDAAPDTECKD